MNSARSRWTTAVTTVTLLLGTLLINTPSASATRPMVGEPTVLGDGTLDLEVVWDQPDSNSVSPKLARAFCPPGKVVIGGGGWVVASRPADDRYIVMTQAQPVHSDTASGYFVEGMEVAGGFGGVWGIDAYAVCGTRPAGYVVIEAPLLPSSSSSVKEAIAECPGSKRVLGTGAKIDNSSGQVTLQTARADAARNIVRAVAKEDANGYSGSWRVRAFAVCADARSGFTTVYGASAETGPQDTKFARATCPPGTFVHDAGASVSGTPSGLLTGPPGVAVLEMDPAHGREATAWAVETTPTNTNWDLVVQAICGP